MIFVSENEADDDNVFDDPLETANGRLGMSAAMNAAVETPRPQVIPAAASKVPPAPAGQKDFALYLTKNQRGALYVPSTMSAKDYDLLKRQIENHLAVIEATSVADKSEE